MRRTRVHCGSEATRGDKMRLETRGDQGGLEATRRGQRPLEVTRGDYRRLVATRGD